MLPLPTWLNIPTAGGSAAINTTGLNMSVLYVPNDLVPAQHLNYFLNGFSNNGNVSETAISNVVSELITILTAASISPNGALTNQVLAALNVLFATVGALATEVTNRTNADDTVASNAAIATNLTSGTVPLARLSGITSSQMAAGNKFRYFNGGVISGNVTFPTIAIGETIVLWYRKTTTGIFNFIFPATGTFNLSGHGIKASSNPNSFAISTSDGQDSTLHTGQDVSGGSTMSANTGGTTTQWCFILTRTA